MGKCNARPQDLLPSIKSKHYLFAKQLAYCYSTVYRYSIILASDKCGNGNPKFNSFSPCCSFFFFIVIILG